MEKLLSLVIPTNGIIEWVVPVIESIYNQGVDVTLFEVVVTDNGISIDFEKKMKIYQKQYDNFIYRKTKSPLFMNQIDAFKLANGLFIKFVNHRTRLTDGSLMKIINFVRNNINEKPITFFLNDSYKIQSKLYDDFDSYAYDLRNYSSWSGGISCWKSDLVDILSSNGLDNELFPHIKFCYYYKNERKYYIHNEKIFFEIEQDDTKKGKYNVFYAFCVEYVKIIKKINDDAIITNRTSKKIIQDNKKFIAYLYYMYILRKKKCSYDLSKYKENISKNYNYIGVVIDSLFIGIKKALFKIKRSCN